MKTLCVIKKEGTRDNRPYPTTFNKNCGSAGFCSNDCMATFNPNLLFVAFIVIEQVRWSFSYKGIALGNHILALQK